MPFAFERGEGMTASVRVFFEQRPVGIIDINKDGPGFSYDPAWLGLRGAFPISTAMPPGSCAMPTAERAWRPASP